MANLVIGDPPALILAEHLLFFSTPATIRSIATVKSSKYTSSVGRGDRGLIDKIGKIGSGETGDKARDFFELDVLAG
jgi:hypothetical protein